MVPRPIESSLAQVLRTKFGIESGPVDLEFFKLVSNFSTPLLSITISSIFGIVLLDIFGMIESVVFVNTDWNCSIRISALPLESDIRQLSGSKCPRLKNGPNRPGRGDDQKMVDSDLRSP